jgi:hypothetical protein
MIIAIVGGVVASLAILSVAILAVPMSTLLGEAVA